VVSRQRYLLFGTLIMTNILYARMDAAVVAWRKVSKMKRDIIGPRNLKTKTP
jgi:hypothetical protein